MNEIEILHLDEECVVVNKPPDLLVHRSFVATMERENVVRTLSRQLGRRVFTVHRLDRATSGVLIFGLDSEAARLLTTQFERREVEKTYHAIVRGYTDDSGTIDMPLKEPYDRIATPAEADTDKPAQEAITDYETLARSELPLSAGKYPTSRYSFVRVSPKTGRRHQIRRHLKHTAHPIVGDIKHGDNHVNQLIEREFGIRRLLLVASELRISHPSTGEAMVLSAAAGGDFDRAREVLQLGAEPVSDLSRERTTNRHE
ncbi:MAG: pseudouridine synthase [Planctomycetales bacterium]|jgi:tRNA pseudouridine65 synthase